jgi:hypothetical protein
MQVLTLEQYRAKLEDKRERLEDASDRASRASDAAYKRVQAISHNIPMGQPVLVGHHSEKHHRADIKRMDNGMRKSIDESNKAAYYAGRAASVGAGGISKEDPEALDKIGERVAELEARQARMKAVNAAHKRYLKNPATLDTAALSDADKELVRHYVPNYSWEPHPYAPYTFSNLNANIRRYKQRAPEVQAAQEAPEQRESFGTVDYAEEECRVQLTFPGKPSDAVRADLRGSGFKWSPTRGAWVRMLSEAARYHGKRIAKAVGGDTCENAAKP